MAERFTNNMSDSSFFFVVFLVIIMSWVLVDLWGRWFNNFTFNTLKLDPKSSYHTFIIALAATIIIVAVIIYLKTLGLPFQDNVQHAFEPENEENFNDYIFRDIIDPQEKLNAINSISGL